MAHLAAFSVFLKCSECHANFGDHGVLVAHPHCKRDAEELAARERRDHLKDAHKTGEVPKVTAYVRDHEHETWSRVAA